MRGLRSDPIRAVPATSNRRIAPLAYLLMWVLLLYLTVPMDVFSSEKDIAFAPSLLSKSIKVGLILVGATVVVRRWAYIKQLFRKLNPFLVLFLTLAPLSYLWSISRPNTLGRCMSVLTMTIVSLAFCATSWSPQQFQRVLRPIITFVVVGSLIFGLVSPELAITQAATGVEKDAWHGLLVQKNPFGEWCALGVVFWMHAWLSKQAPWWQGVLFGGASFACVVLSRSSTSLLASLFTILFLLLLMRSPKGLRRYLPYIVALFAGTVLTYALAVLRIIPGLDILFKPVALVTGKDTSFSARSTIWQIIQDHIALRPYLGSGYGAYWIGPDPSSPSFIFLSRMYFYPTESHSGYLEIVNDLGYVGLGCLLGYLVVFVRQSLQIMRIDRTQGALFLGLFFAQAIANLTESNWFQVNSTFVFAIMTLATCAMSSALLQHERQTLAANAHVVAARPQRGAFRTGTAPRFR